MGNDNDDYYLNDDDLINEAIANADDQDHENDAMEEDYGEYYDEEMEDALPPHNTNTNSKNLESNEEVGGHAVAAVAVVNNASSITPMDSSGSVVLPVPQIVSTSPTAKSTSSRHHHPTTLNNFENDDLYKFERYTGLSSWRTTTSGNSATNTAVDNGAHAGRESDGATTMEATSWKKKEDQPMKKKKRHDDDEDDDDFDEEAEESVEGNAESKSREVGVASGSGAAGGGIGSQAQQLVRFREKEELILLGRSWGGRRRNDHDSSSNNKTKKDDVDYLLPQLGEASMAMTLADGTRTFIKKRCASSVGNDKRHAQGRGEEEQCLLSLPMTELIRRADILQKRAIQRKIEREGTTANKTKARDDGGIVDENVDGDDENVEVGRNNSSANDVDCETTVDDADYTEKQHDNEEKKKKVTFQLQTQSIHRKRQHHKLLQLQQRLWVDKHAPTSISHLLSDERTNREVLRALREWDPYVFKKEAPARPTPAYPSKFGQQQQQQQYGKDSKKNGRKDQGKKNDLRGGKDGDNIEGTSTNQRIDVRPDESSRVILLSGPPGVGKFGETYCLVCW